MAAHLEERKMGMTDEAIREREQEALRDEYVKELQRLLACYQIASRDDKNVVWSALNKYLPHINVV